MFHRACYTDSLSPFQPLQEKDIDLATENSQRPILSIRDNVDDVSDEKAQAVLLQADLPPGLRSGAYV